MGIVSGIFRKLPPTLKHEIQRFRYRYLIGKSRFRSDEREYDLVERLIKPGETVVDIGANVGYYTVQFSRLVGNTGMVLAFEPITRTFDLLSSNVFFAKCENVTLINTLVSKEAGTVGFTVPNGNYFQAHIAQNGELRRMALPLTLFDQPGWTPDFLKIDAEGLDMEIITSSKNYINKCRPTVMAELAKEILYKTAIRLERYTAYALLGSHNGFLVPEERENDFVSSIEPHPITKIEKSEI